MAFNPYDKYKQQSVMTMTQGEMVVRLYDEVIKSLSAAVAAVDSKDYPKANNAFLKSERIINHFRATLNFECEISNNLDMLYAFFLQTILTANIKKEKEGVEEIIPMIIELRDAFAQAEKTVRMQFNGTTTVPQAPTMNMAAHSIAATV